MYMYSMHNSHMHACSPVYASYNEIKICSPAKVVFLSAVSHTSSPLLQPRQAVHLRLLVKRILDGRRQSHGLATPRMGTPSDVRIGVNKRFDVKVEKSLSHFSRHRALNNILILKNDKIYTLRYSPNEYENLQSYDGHMTAIENTHQYYRTIKLYSIPI